MSGAIAKNYAKALFEVASERGTIDTVEQELARIVEVINSDEDLRKVLMHPHIPLEAKKKLVLQLFDGQLSEMTANFLNLIVDRHREDFLDAIFENFVMLANEARGIAEATVTTAKELSAEELEQLTQKFGKLLNKKLRIKTKVNPEILGGVVVRIGDRLYDGSISGKLARFQQRLKQSQVR